MRQRHKTEISHNEFKDMVDEQRIAHIWQRIQGKRRKAELVLRRLPVLSGAAATLLFIGIAAAFHLSKPPRPTPSALSFNLSESTMLSVPPDAREQKRIPFSDGSMITLSTGAALEIKDNTSKRFLTSLHRGWVRYNVIPNQARTWELDAGLCRIVVLGTQFTVNRTDRAVNIVVHRGTVAVHSATGDETLVTLTAGHRYTALAPTAETAPKQIAHNRPPSREDVSSPEDDNRQTRTARPGARSAPSRRTTMPIPASGAILAGLGASRIVNDVLKRADVARQKRRPRKAAALLQRILDNHSDDPAVGLVALTLGNIHLDTLHQPQVAARAFKRATLSKTLPRPLREQAYARCVEAFHRAGDHTATQTMAAKYRHRYPGGAWRTVIDRWANAE